MALTFDIKTTGVDHLIDRLKGFEPEVYKVLQREIKAAADVVGKSARGLTPARPLPNWGVWGGRLDYDGAAVAAAIKPAYRSRRVGGQRYVMGLVNTKSAPGNVYALAGSQTKTGWFNEYLRGTWGTSFPRALGPAWTMHVDEARDQIQDAIYRAAEKVT